MRPTARRSFRDTADEVADRLTARRPASMARGKFKLPRDVRYLVRNLFEEYDHYSGEVETDEERFSLMEWIFEEGFKEGFLFGQEAADAGKARRREICRKANEAKRRRRQLDTRNARIVSRFHQLAKSMPGKEDRYLRLAEENDISDRQIREIIKANSTRRPT